MANNERLTKRVKKIEEWVAENEEMGGPKGYLDTMVAMYQGNMQASMQMKQLDQQFHSQMQKLLLGKRKTNGLDRTKK